MARTPLFKRLQKMLTVARVARKQKLPAAEIWGMRRREFLSKTGMVGAALPLVGCMPALTACGSSSSSGPRIGIVGGGLAGLHCAYRLSNAGLSADVFDASNRLGGRMFTDRTTFPDGMHCELGGELIDTGHSTMIDLAQELGIALLDYQTDDAELRTLIAHINGKILTDEEILSGFSPIAAAIDDALATLTDQEDLFVYYNKPNGGEALDALSLTAWLDQIAAEGPVRELLEVAYNIEYGLEASETNVLNMLFLISTDTTSFKTFGDSDERFHTTTGNDTYISKLAEKLGDENLYLEHRLVAARQASDSSYVLTFDRGGSMSDETFDHVVFALPFTLLREVDLTGLDLPSVKKRAINELGYGTNAKLMCGFSTRVWREQDSNGETFTDLGFQSTWETSRLQTGTSGIITNFTGGNPGIAMGEGTPEQRRDDFLNQFDTVFPGAKAASNGKVARFHWPSHPFTKGSYSSYKVGQYTTITGSEIERVGRLHFAGEHTSLDAQGYMEGAALTGAMAAQEILTDEGVEQIARTVPSHRIMMRAMRGAKHRRLRV